MNNTYNQCLSLLNQCKTLKAVKQIHASLLKTAPGLDAFSAGKLLLHCAVTISDSLDYARRFFLHFPNPDVFMYNTLVRGFSESDKPQNSITTFIEMRRKCLDPPDSFSFAFVLKAATNLRSLKSGIQLHCQALVHGLDGHLFVGTTLISMYGECERADLSMKVFDEMSDPNVVVWNAVVTACFRSGDVKNAERVFNTMPFWNLTTWNTGNWQWKFKDSSINIYYEEHERESSDPTKNILMIPTISDVSTVEEWRSVAKDIAQRDGKVNWRATIVDWPGLGYSDRPKMDYNADVMENFQSLGTFGE
ncbi:hypothetical protein Patl1_18752 [Pistacia atlantica]|uniref:Uncharacterized protein n=1 Tax=Pistacia atlantica TaxID=434234 RepID=A0ACC1BYK3_9ROSI|nr:hypothetical protein Patl1_18752 [Pistacia atlantica]